MKKIIALSVLLGIFMGGVSAFGQCSLYINPTVAELQTGGPSADVCVVLTNEGPAGFFLDSVILSSNLNDASLTTTATAVAGTFVPVGGAYEFTLRSNPTGVPPSSANVRFGIGTVYVHSNGPFVQNSCSFVLIADFNPCSFSPNPPVTTVELTTGGPFRDVNVRLAPNFMQPGFTLDSVVLYFMLNDGFLVTTHNAVSGTPVPPGGAYDFNLRLNPAGVPPSAEGIRLGAVAAFVTNALFQQQGCAFHVAADVFVPRAKGDMNASGDLGISDIALLLNCVFLRTCTFLKNGRCALTFADVNCSGDLSPADVVTELFMVFLGAPPGC